MIKSSARERRQQKTRQGILAAARQIIAEKGSAELSMRLLAEWIDYSPSGLYEYFDSKEDILLALNLEGHQQLTWAMRQVDAELSPQGYLIEIGMAYIRFALHNPDLYRIMFSDTPQIADYAAMQIEGSSFPILLKAIQRGLDEGIFKVQPGYELYEMAYACWVTVHGIAMLRLYQANFPPDFDRVVREVLLGLGRGLSN